MATLATLAVCSGRVIPADPNHAIVGSEEARLHASLRPPLKLHVRFSRMQLSRRHMTWDVSKRQPPSGPGLHPEG